MLINQIPRLMIAGTHSGCGKTSVMCAVLKALVDQGKTIAAFKCGPDYIDPMFHQEIIGAAATNLDLFLLSETIVNYLLAENAKNADIAIIEGVMGFYDGVGGSSEQASAHHLATTTATPVVLVVDAAGAALSTAAVVKGFYQWTHNNIAAVILNQVSPALFKTLKQTIEQHVGVPVIGYLPRLPNAKINSRHLGLLTAGEIDDLKDKVRLLGEAAAASIDLDALLNLAKRALPHRAQSITIPRVCHNKTIAVAKDQAFCFYYADSLRLLEQMGAKLCYFSPLTATCLPPNTSGLIIGGGYPELYSEQLSRNVPMLTAIRHALNQGLPVIAECGGFMYLHETMCGQPMVGFIKGHTQMTNRLQRFGYITLTAQQDNILCRQGESINAHEFHYSDSSNCGSDFMAVKPQSGNNYLCAHSGSSFYAGYPHLNLWGNISFARNFLTS